MRFAVWLVAGLAMCATVAYTAYERVEQPASQLFGKTLTSGPHDERVVALTFDDGPNPPYTNEILTVLERERVPATFFVVGRAVEAFPGVVRREVRDGDAVGNHSWDHAHLIMLSRSQIRDSLRRTNAAIEAAAHLHTTLMRPPFGARDWIVMQVARKLGYTVVMWSVPLAGDWNDPPARVITSRILPYVSDGSIIVLHDGNRGEICTAQDRRVCDRSSDIGATRAIVEALKREHYRFVTIPQLISLGMSSKHTPAPGSE